MNETCQSFRRLLATSLSGGLVKLGWHDHLLHCADCRRVLEAEEALDLLLANLPSPELPPALAQRVLQRLGSPADSLDRLLELDARPPAAPAHLAASILVGARLDRLLDADGPVEVPEGLAERVLAGVRRVAASPEKSEAVAAQQQASSQRAGFRLLRGGAPVLRRAAAAAVLIAFGALAWQLRPSAQVPLADTPSVADAGGEVFEPADQLVEPQELDAVDDELLASLDLLEHLELADSLDPVTMDALVYLDVSDEIVWDWDELADGSEAR